MPDCILKLIDLATLAGLQCFQIFWNQYATKEKKYTEGYKVEVRKRMGKKKKSLCHAGWRRSPFLEYEERKEKVIRVTRQVCQVANRVSGTR